MFFGLPPNLQALNQNETLRHDFSDLTYEGVEDLFDLVELHRSSQQAGLREKKIKLNEDVAKKMQRKWPQYALSLIQKNNEVKKLS